MSAVLTPEQRAEWREDVTTCEGRLVDDAAEAGAAEQVTAALAEVERAIRKARHDRLSQMERNGMKVAELVVREVRQSLTGDEPCSCGAPQTYSLNPAEVVVHRRDGQPCYIAPVDAGGVRS